MSDNIARTPRPQGADASPANGNALAVGGHPARRPRRLPPGHPGTPAGKKTPAQILKEVAEESKGRECRHDIDSLDQFADVDAAPTDDPDCRHPHRNPGAGASLEWALR